MQKLNPYDNEEMHQPQEKLTPGITTLRPPRPTVDTRKAPLHNQQLEYKKAVHV